MTTIAVASTRGAELSRISDVLAVFYGLLTKSTTYVEPLRDGEASLFSLPPDTDEDVLAHVQLSCSDPAQTCQQITTAIRDCKMASPTVIVGLPCHALYLSADFLQLIDLFLIQTIPAQASVADAIRLLSDVRRIQQANSSQSISTDSWILGAGCAGGPAIAARLRNAAALVLAREENTSLRPEDLPILRWGMPLLHWSTWDQLSIPKGKEPSRHIGRACHTLYRQVVLLTQRPKQAPSFEDLAADSTNFFEPWLLDDSRSPAQVHLDLAEDLSLIESGFGPIPQDFLDTAHLDEWGIATRTFKALEGTVSDHPEQPTGDWIRTSEVVKFGPDRKWARTLSRFYTLGTPADDEPHAPDAM